VLEDTHMMYWYNFCRSSTRALLFFCGVFSLTCTVIASGFEPNDGLVYFVYAQNKKLVLPFSVACLSRLMHDNTLASSITLDLSESYAHKLITCMYYAYGLFKQEHVTAQVKAAYEQITFEDVAQLASSIDRLQFFDEFSKIYAKLFAQKFFDTSILARCAEDKEYTQKLFTLMPDEYLYQMFEVVLVQWGYLLWGPLHTLVNRGIDEIDSYNRESDDTSTQELITSILIKKQCIIPDSRTLLCYKLAQQGRILVLVTSDLHTIFLELYDIKNNVLCAQICTSILGCQESSYSLDISPDLFNITLTTLYPGAERAQQKIKTVVQTFDISSIVKLLPCKDLLFLLICEYAKIHNKPIDQAYIAYFSSDPLSIMHEAILRYSSTSSPYMSLRRCSVS
jgi:hypothetical protein